MEFWITFGFLLGVAILAAVFVFAAIGEWLLGYDKGVSDRLRKQNHKGD